MSHAERVVIVPTGSRRLGEERPEQVAARLGLDSGDDRDLVVEPRIGGQVVEAAGRAGLRIGRAEHEQPEPAVQRRPRAHRAGLERHDERAVVEPPSLDRQRRVAQGQDLGVRGRVAQQLALVVAPGDDLAVGEAGDDRADGDVAVLGCGARLFERDRHQPLDLVPAPSLSAPPHRVGRPGLRHPSPLPTSNHDRRPASWRRSLAWAFTRGVQFAVQARRHREETTDAIGTVRAQSRHAGHGAGRTRRERGSWTSEWQRGRRWCVRATWATRRPNVGARSRPPTASCRTRSSRPRSRARSTR